MKTMRTIYKALIISMLVSSCHTVKTTTAIDPVPTKPIEDGKVHAPIMEAPKQIKKDDYEKIMEVFNKTVGTAYLYGGTGDSGWDCSGYVNYVYDKVFGIDLPRSTELMWNHGKRVGQPMVGDLVFFSPSNSYNHVGIYIGNDQFIHSSSSKGVMKSRVHDKYYWGKYFIMYRRVK